MWNSNTPTGEMPPKPKEAWQSGLQMFKLKIDVHEWTEEMVDEHMWDSHEAWREANEGVSVGFKDRKCDLYLNVNSVTGEITIVGVNGHPLDMEKRLI